MKILVTGGAGYIGSHTVKELIRAGHEVHVIDNLIRGHREAIFTKHFYHLDLKDKNKIDIFFNQHKVEAVIHFAAFAYVGESIENPAKYYYNNTVNTLNLLSSMLDNGVKKIIFSSTCSTYGETGNEKPLSETDSQVPINPYAKSKFFIEQIIKDLHSSAGLKYVILRYFNAAGADPEGELGEDHTPETHLIPLVLRAAVTGTPVRIFGKDYPTIDGTCIRDYVHVTDLATAHLSALNYIESKNGCFNVGSGKGVSVLSIINKCEEITGIKIKKKFAPRRPGDPAILVAKNSLALSELNWKPVHSKLDSIISTAWDWHCKHPDGYT